MVRNVDQETLNALLAVNEPLIMYLYTPMCGTCQVAGKMIDVVFELFPTLTTAKINLNYIPEQAERWKIENVPCLLFFKNGEIQQRLYAFHSVPYLYEELKKFVDKIDS